MQNKLYVGNVSNSIAEGELKAFFEQYGNVTEVVMPIDKYNGQPRGFAFVTFEDQSTAQKALTANGKDLKGRPLKVNVAQDRDKSGGSRSGGGMGGGGRGQSRW